MGKTRELLNYFNFGGYKEVIALQNLPWIIAMVRMPQTVIGGDCGKTSVPYGGIPCCKQHISASGASGWHGGEVGR